MYSAFDHWAYLSHMLTVISMFSPCTQWVFGPLSPVSVQSVEYLGFRLGPDGLSMDFIEHLPESSGFTAILVIVDRLSLGTRAQIPTGYMVKTLRSQSTCDLNMPSNQMLSTF